MKGHGLRDITQVHQVGRSFDGGKQSLSLLVAIQSFQFELTVPGYSVVYDWDRHQRQRCLSAGLAVSKWIPVDIFNSA